MELLQRGADRVPLPPGVSRSWRFTAPGQAFTGVVQEVSEVPRTEIGPGGVRVPLLWPDGAPKMQLLVRLSTDDRDPLIPDDDGTRFFAAWGAKKSESKSRLAALIDAMCDGGLTDIPVGATLTVTALVVAPSPNPQRIAGQYSAKILPPKPGLLAREEPTPAPAQSGGEEEKVETLVVAKVRALVPLIPSDTDIVDAVPGATVELVKSVRSGLV